MDMPFIATPCFGRAADKDLKKAFTKAVRIRYWSLTVIAYIFE
jgi:hypothetical protein